MGGTSLKSTGGNGSLMRFGSLSRPTTPDAKSASTTRLPTMAPTPEGIVRSQAESNGRPMTAPQVSMRQTSGSADEASRSRGLFRKKVRPSLCDISCCLEC